VPFVTRETAPAESSKQVVSEGLHRARRGQLAVEQQGLSGHTSDADRGNAKEWNCTGLAVRAVPALGPDPCPP